MRCFWCDDDEKVKARIMPSKQQIKNQQITKYRRDDKKRELAIFRFYHDLFRKNLKMI